MQNNHKYHYLVVPAKEKREGETDLPEFKMYYSGYDESPYKIERVCFEDSSPSPELVKTMGNWQSIPLRAMDLRSQVAG